MERELTSEDAAAVLLSVHRAGGKAAAVTWTSHLVEDGPRGITSAHKVCVNRVKFQWCGRTRRRSSSSSIVRSGRETVVGGDECLAHHLAAVHATRPRWSPQATAAEEIAVQLLQFQRTVEVLVVSLLESTATLGSTCHSSHGRSPRCPGERGCGASGRIGCGASGRIGCGASARRGEQATDAHRWPHTREHEEMMVT
jgi:hypothetical protein